MHTELTLEQQIDQITTLIEKHEDETHTYYGQPQTLPQRLRYVLDYHTDRVSKALLMGKSFRDDMLHYFKAMELIVDMVLSASTHAEKDARLRGMVELLQSSLKKLENTDFAENRMAWFYDDVFRSDKPTYLYVRRIHELEEEVKRLKEAQNGRE